MTVSNSSCLVLLAICSSPVALATPNAATEVPGREHEAPEDRPRVVAVKPVILCDDDGRNPARFSLPKTLVDRVEDTLTVRASTLDELRRSHAEELAACERAYNALKQGYITTLQDIIINP